MTEHFENKDTVTLHRVYTDIFKTIYEGRSISLVTLLVMDK